MKYVFALLLILTTFTTASAQFSDSVHYYGKFASMGSINTTQDGRAYLLNNSFKVGVSKKKISLNGSGGWIYGQQDGTLTNNDFASALDFSLFRSVRQIYYWGLATYDKSYSLKINDRFQGGAGIAYNLLDSKKAYLSLSDGLLFETSNLFLEDTIPDIYHTFRNSFRLLYKFVIHDIVVIDGAHFLQNSLSLGRDFNIKSTSNLSILLNKWLSITATLTYNKLNRTGRENLLFNYGLTVEKYF
ncbi:DUF481 domain-containing protein [Chitinophaga pinensis]|uniref:DUF481 domain-containing protein n=1 Tax=Chitinophaga pinensis (strain ATCC 43595 / DSM 2588 / LMG 13176 / NBRC 15968 / NCIMB 11800 / UQM 2034) TaxID=485918 RepID=A0A979G9M2_CHIPD|nr:DUF481 domain-containing protein [Chitinophaga pinensis]ACU63235.1 hypothetical protein Cpin_5816 [Chitinophaga pinensis DSM 2588]